MSRSFASLETPPVPASKPCADERLQCSRANPLYVQAITTLLPSNGGDASTAPRKATAEDICQGELGYPI